MDPWCFHKTKVELIWRLLGGLTLWLVKGLMAGILDQSKRQMALCARDKTNQIGQSFKEISWKRRWCIKIIMLPQICFRYIACCTLTSRESGQCYEENTHLSIYYLSTLPYQEVILLPVESIIYSYRKRLVYKYLRERGKKWIFNTENGSCFNKTRTVPKSNTEKEALTKLRLTSSALSAEKYLYHSLYFWPI